VWAAADRAPMAAEIQHQHLIMAAEAEAAALFHIQKQSQLLQVKY
jgi:hypothetical protein